MLNTHKGIFYCWTKLSSKTHFKSSDTDIQRDVELQLPGLAYSESCPSEVFPPLTSSSKPEASASAQRDHHGNKRPERKPPDNRNTIILVSSRLWSRTETTVGWSRAVRANWLIQHFWHLSEKRKRLPVRFIFHIQETPQETPASTTAAALRNYCFKKLNNFVSIQKTTVPQRMFVITKSTLSKMIFGRC